MPAALAVFFRRHPVLVQCLLWALPALAVGAALRMALLSYLPLAYWGSDSGSYYGFAFDLFEKGKISVYDKRRYLYLFFVAIPDALPGSTLRWLAWFQHGVGLATLLPLAYCIRKTFSAWKAWIVPVTVAYAGFPLVLWYEHELLAETLFFASVIWMIAGWCAWVGQPDPVRARRLWWWFFAGLAAFVLTKSSGRFLWPGVLIALAAVGSWRVLRWKHAGALAGLFGISLTIGQDSQGAWLLYTSAFPLTRMETPLHAEYKREVGDLVAEARAKLERGDPRDASDTASWKLFLKNPQRQDARPLFKALGEDPKLRSQVYKDLAMEGIRHRPDLFAKVSLMKIAASANLPEFNVQRFHPSYFFDKYDHHYERDLRDQPRRLHRLFGIPRGDALPDYEGAKRIIAPDPDPPLAGWMVAYAERYQNAVAFFRESGKIGTLRFAGWWILLAVPLAFLPGTFRTAGVWVLALGGYLFGVFLVGGVNPRFFGPVWPVLFLIAPVPLDALWRVVRGRLGAGRAA